MLLASKTFSDPSGHTSLEEYQHLFCAWASSVRAPGPLIPIDLEPLPSSPEGFDERVYGVRFWYRSAA